MVANGAWTMGQHRDSIRCLLLPLAGYNLLLPSVSIAEVLREATIRPEPDTPEWMAGTVEWRSVLLPLLSFEVLAGESCSEPAGRSRVAVFHALSRERSLDFYGILIQDIPHIVQARESGLTLLHSREEDKVVLSRVEIEGQLAVIPDLELMEKHAGSFSAGFKTI